MDLQNRASTFDEVQREKRTEIRKLQYGRQPEDYFDAMRFSDEGEVSFAVRGDDEKEYIVVYKAIKVKIGEKLIDSKGRVIEKTGTEFLNKEELQNRGFHFEPRWAPFWQFERAKLRDSD